MRTSSSPLFLFAAMVSALAACKPTIHSGSTGGSGSTMTSTSTGGGTGTSTGGDTSASTGGDTSASTGGDTSASTGGDTSASTGGDTSASTSGDTSASASSSTSSGSGGASAGRAFQLVGAYWDGAQEVVERVDPVTGAGTLLGTLGALHWWSYQLVLDVDATHVYAVGMPSDSGPTTLYTLDLASGVSTQALIDHNYALGGITDDGKAIGVYWTGAAEAVDLIDPVSGTSAFVGNLGDLQFWSSQLVYDRDARILHAIGLDPANASQLYSLGLDTHASTKVPVSNNYFLGGVTTTGALLGAFWNGSVELVDEVNPATGVGTSHGQLGDLYTWTSGGFTLDVATGRAYASGNTGMNAQKLYTLDLGSTTTTAAPTSTLYVLARQ